MSSRIYLILRLFLVSFLFLGVCINLDGQNRIFEEDVIYLKNGSVLRGEIISQEVGDYVKIRLREGIVFTYKTTEVEKISREAAKFTRIKMRFKKGFLPTRFSEKEEYYNQISFGLAMNEINGQSQVDFTGQIRILKHINQLLHIGGGSGIDFYEGGLIIPVFAEIQGDFFKKRITPFYSLQGGYGIGAGGTPSHIFFKGGIIGHAALGLHMYTVNKRSYFLSLGFKFQETYQEYRESSSNIIFIGVPSGPDPPLVIGTRRYQKFVLQYSYTF